MEKEIEIRAKIIKAIKSNASPNAITRYWEMSTDDIEQAAAEIFEALNPTSDSKREPEGFTDEQIRTLIKKLKEE